MKKKVLAFLLASTMVIEPFSVASAADFSDGTGQDTVQFSDDTEDVPEVETDVDGVDQFSTDAVGEGESGSNPSEDAIQMGDDVWVKFDDTTGTATISGTGDMWDFYENGYDYTNKHQNPFIGKSGIKKIIIKDGVTSVGNYFLYGCRDNHGGNSLEEVTLGKNIKKIGDKAFWNCYMLKMINLPEGLEEIGENSFSGSLFIEKFVIPNSIKKIGIGCFSKCSKLKTVEFLNELKIKIIPDDAFASCYNLTEINLPAGIKDIGQGAFYNCTSLTEIKLPSGIENIGKNAFHDCSSLMSITLPKTLKVLGDDVFWNCTNLATVNFEEGFSCNIPGYAFEECSSLVEITIPKGVSNIAQWAFYKCSRLSTVIIEGNTTGIGSNAFNDCPNLRIIKSYDCSYAKKYYDSLTDNQKKSITFDSLGEGLHQFTSKKIQIKEPTCTEKGSKAYTCEICGVTKDEEEIPAYGHDWNNGVITKKPTETEAGEKIYTCWNCNTTKTESIPKLSAIRFENVDFGWNLYDRANINGRANKAISYYITTVDKNSSVPEYDETHDTQESSQNGYFGIDITVPDEEVDVYIFAVDTEGNHTYYKVTPNYNNRPQKPSNTVKVGDDITATIEGDTLTLTGTGATYDYAAYGHLWYEGNLSKIKKVVFDGNITYIGNAFFSGCNGLEEVILPEGLQKLGQDTFEFCDSLRKIVFPSSLKSIPMLGGETLYSNLNQVIIPEGIETIEAYAFSDCKNLTEIVLPSTIKNIGASAFDHTGITSFTLPKNVTKISDGVFAGTNLEIFSVPETITEIGDNAFSWCTNLKKITIPESVKYIGLNAFRECRNLEIHGKRDSEAERYAYVNNIKFVSGKYKVVFKNNGRTIDTYYIDEGGSVLTPPSLEEKPGYTLSWDADYTNITEDMVINAVWTKKDNGNGGGTTIIVNPSETKYTVTFKDRGKIVKTEKVKSGDAAEYPFITRNGYELSWDKDFSKITADVTVNAVWTVIKPDKVTSLTAEVQKNSIDLSWDRAENTDYYLVYRKATSDTEYKQIKKTTKILWTDEDVEPGTEYSYKVVGICSVDGKKYQGADSDIVIAKIGTPQIGDVYSVGNLKYKITGAKEVNVIGLAKEAVDIKIPSAVSISGKAYKVTSVQDKAFYQNEDIVNVTIGNNVTYVGKYAFYQCPNLETVKFGKRVSSISTCAFSQCPNLENVTLPSSIRKIGAKAFYQCTSIKTLKINGSALEYVGKKGLAVNKSVTLKLPKKYYSKYQKLIKASSTYAKTKFVKF